MPGSNYPYVGHIWSLGELPGMTIMKWHNELGPLINLKMGVKNWVLVDDPILAQKIFVSNGVKTSFRSRNVFTYDHYSKGGMGLAFAQPDDRWKFSRSAALTVLAPKHIIKYLPTIRKEARDVTNRFLEATEKQGFCDPVEEFKLYALNVIFKTVAGRSFSSKDDPDYKKLKRIMEFNIKNSAWENDLSNFLPILSVYEYFFGTLAEQKTFIRDERDPFFTRVVEDSDIIEGPNVLKSLAEAGFDLSFNEKLVLASDIILAAADTVSVSMAWNICALMHHPDIQNKVSAEIDEFVKLNGELPGLNDKDSMPYTMSVMKEGLRFKATTPLGLAHTTREDVFVDGYMIPKHSAIISSMDSMHLRADVYPEPEKYIPERFLSNTKPMQTAANGKVEDRDHFNFGWGRRICPGISMAEAQLFIALIEIFSTCHILPTSEDGLPDTDNAVNGGLTAPPAPYKAMFVKRTDIRT
ncbi:hypothetical protein MFLAVUS_002008 [Mucor flavus]|uniref:Cytochrome P450 n=1 Tax=Mucor flavus TaxID=439312 RepID=A0ABP9YP36_9FUNG